jgi:thiaminase (transcriptional activator TenA)
MHAARVLSCLYLLAACSALIVSPLRLRSINLRCSTATMTALPGEPQQLESLSSKLWSLCKQDALNSLYHPFVLQLATGKLPKTAFQAYIVQDAFFLEAFAKAYRMASMKAFDNEGKEAFAGLIAAVSNELRLHHAYASEWGVDLRAAIAKDGPLPATRAYTSFLLQVSYAANCKRSLAAFCRA